MVKLKTMVKIYTKTGDTGTTSLVDGKRVSKTDRRLEAYGTVDELNATIGTITQHSVFGQENVINNIQNDLFNIGSNLATEDSSVRSQLPQISESSVEVLEKAIDEMNAQLPVLKNFVLPGGTPANAHAHMARTVCRRAERRVIALEDDTENAHIIIKYLNRLSDYFFVLSRYVLHRNGGTERLWTK
jgi:cob(I)alamin adenosyltransferase